MGKTSDFYKSSAKARKVKADYQKKYNKKKSAVEKRVKDNKANRKAGTYGNGDGKDYDRKTGRMVKASTNRGRAGEGGRKRVKNKNKGPKKRR